MRTASKKLAFMLAVVLAVSVLPMMVSAAAGDLDTLAIRGVTVTGAEDGNAHATKAALVAAAPLSVELTQTLMLDSEKDIFAATGTNSANITVRYLTAADSAALIDATHSTDAAWLDAIETAGDAAVDGLELSGGDYIWVVIGTDTDASAALRVLIKQAADEINIGGGSTIENPVFNVRLPMDLDFKVDPLQLGDVIGNGSQLSRQAYTVVNKSNAPVNVSVSVKVNEATNVELVDDAANLVNAMPHTGTTKHAFVSVIAANGFTTVSTGSDEVSNFTSTATKGVFNYDPSVEGTVFQVPAMSSASASDQKVDFILTLGPATDGNDDDVVDTLAANNAGIAAFSLMGELDTYAAWAPNDISLTGTFKLQGAKTSDYATATTVGLNVLGEPSDDPENFVKFTAPGQMTLKMDRDELATYSIANGGEGWNVYLAQMPASITMVKNFVSNGVWAEGTQFDYDPDTGVMTILGNPPAAPTQENPMMPGIVIDTPLGAYVLRFDFE